MGAKTRIKELESEIDALRAENKRIKQVADLIDLFVSVPGNAICYEEHGMHITLEFRKAVEVAKGRLNDLRRQDI